MDGKDIKFSGISYEEDELGFLKNIYEEAKTRQDELEEVNEENRLFYEGIDEKLNMRATNKDVDMSHLFIHQLKPAIDTRKAAVIAAVEEKEYPISFRPAGLQPTDEERNSITVVEQRINEQMRDIGYLVDGYEEHITGAEIYRSPSAIKISIENKNEKVPVLANPSPMEIMKSLLGGEQAKPRVKWVNKDGVDICIEWLPPDQFLYEPNVSDFSKSQYAIHVNYVYPHDLSAMAEDLGWDKDKLQEYRNDNISDGTGSTDEAFQDKVDSERDVPHAKKKHDDKILVQEIYLATYNDSGEEVIRQIFMIDNKVIVSNKVSPYKGLRFPFVLAVTDKLPGTLEGLSAVDIGKQTQRLYNELFNMYIDAVGYTTFKPLVKDPGTHFTKQPRWGYGEIWEVTNQEGLRPLIDNPGQIPNLPPLMASVAGLLRSNLTAEDLSQGFNANPNEKATSSQLRSMGAARKSFGWKRRYGMVLVEVASMVLALNQQYAEDKESYVFDMLIDVPSLTGVTDPDQEKQDALLLLNQFVQMPMAQTPLGQTKVRNLYQNVLEKFVKHDWQRFLQTDEEMKQELQIQTEEQQAMMDKQNAQEQMAVDMQTQQVMSQGGQGGV